MEGSRAWGVRRGIQVQGEMLIMGRMKGTEWDLVSRPSHTLACSMLLELHKLPHNYPGGMLREERQARGGDSERGKRRTGCQADRHQEV